MMALRIVEGGRVGSPNWRFYAGPLTRASPPQRAKEARWGPRILRLLRMTTCLWWGKHTKHYSYSHSIVPGGFEVMS